MILPSESQIIGLRDSKKVPPEQREALYCEIIDVAVAYGVIAIDASEIDASDILRATMLGMRRAIGDLATKPGVVLIDGNQKPGSGLIERAVIKGDDKSAAIMAASILAKVTRDDIMTEAHKEFPMYGFDEHKGYGCEMHIEAIRKHGPCRFHRRSFEPLKSMFQPVLGLEFTPS